VTELLLRIGVSNLCVSLALALVAWAVQSTGKRPGCAHLLWLLVLVKLVTPPLVTVPVITVPRIEAAVPVIPAFESAGVPHSESAAMPVVTPSATPWWGHTNQALALLWLFGSACVLIWSLARIYRFNRLLGMASEPAPQGLRATAAELAGRLGLTNVPSIRLTSARISPMVWWVGGSVRVFLPAGLPCAMDAAELRLILAHELAHVRRRDHFARWLEWFACVAFWWNPVAWWARRNLRTNEEICCDALVLTSLKPAPRTYANSLLTAVEFLTSPALRPPVMASGVNSGGSLERRFNVIVSNRPLSKTPRWALAAMLALLPLGVAYAQSPDYDAVAARLAEAVAAGELSAEEAGDMMAELGRSAFEKQLRAMKARRGKRAGRTDADVARVKKELWTMVKAGKITEAQAKQRLEGFMNRGRRERRMKYAAVERRLKAAVDAGKMSAEEAEKKLADLKQQVWGKREDPRKARHEAAAREIMAAVKAGKISEEDARKRLEEMRRHLLEKEGKVDPRDAAMRQRLEKAVKSGKLSEAEAKQHWKAYEQDKAGAGKPTEAELAKVKRKIWAAVAAGKITEKQAEERWQGYLKSLRAR